MEQSLVLPSLKATPRLLRDMLAGASAEQAWQPPKAGEWAMGDVVRHLVAADSKVFLPRVRRMLSEDNPTFASIEDVLAPSRDLEALLTSFAEGRTALVSLLEPTDNAGWQRAGVIPRGAVTVASYMSVVAEHDVEHLRQIQEVRQTLGLPPKWTEARLALPMSEIVAVIDDSPAKLREAARDLSAEQLRWRPAPGEWSIKEVMAHLLKVEQDLFRPRLRRMVEEERPAFPPFDPDAWARERDHREGDFAEDWRRFAAVRAENVAYLRALPPGAEERLGLSGWWGPVRLGEYATHMVEHDREHLAQIAACRRALR